MHLAHTKKRFIIALAGAPGSGKSTLAQHLYEALNRVNAEGETALEQHRKKQCQIVAMDGFHLDNEILIQRGLIATKGAPNTFDTQGLLQLIQQLSQADTLVSAPRFDRDIDAVILGAIDIPPNCKYIIVEGNYLLLDHFPWSSLQPYFDLSLFLDVPFATLQARLEQRWLDQGLSQELALAKTEENDLPNGRYTIKHSVKADVLITSH